MCGYSRWESDQWVSHLSPWSTQNGCQDSPLDFSLVPPHYTSHCMGCWILFDAVSHSFKSILLQLELPNFYLLRPRSMKVRDILLFSTSYELLKMIYIRVVTFIGSGSHMDYTRRWVLLLWCFFLQTCSCSSPKGWLCTLRVRKHYFFSLSIRYTRSMECLPFSQVTDLQVLKVRLCSTYRSSFLFWLNSLQHQLYLTSSKPWLTSHTYT